jgi:hypothetical protein
MHHLERLLNERLLLPSTQITIIEYRRLWL